MGDVFKNNNNQQEAIETLWDYVQRQMKGKLVHNYILYIYYYILY